MQAPGGKTPFWWFTRRSLVSIDLFGILYSYLPLLERNLSSSFLFPLPPPHPQSTRTHARTVWGGVFFFKLNFFYTHCFPISTISFLSTTYAQAQLFLCIMGMLEAVPSCSDPPFEGPELCFFKGGGRKERKKTHTHIA